MPHQVSSFGKVISSILVKDFPPFPFSHVFWRKGKLICLIIMKIMYVFACLPVHPSAYFRAAKARLIFFWIVGFPNGLLVSVVHAFPSLIPVMFVVASSPFHAACCFLSDRFVIFQSKIRTNLILFWYKNTDPFFPSDFLKCYFQYKMHVANCERPEVI